MSWGRLLGQERAVGALKELVASGRLPPALLFHGPAGVGKSLAALETAKALQCPAPPAPGEACDACPSCLGIERGADPDLKRLDAEYQARLLGEEAERQQHLKVESVRHLVRDLEMRSLAGRWKVAVLEDAEGMLASAANALLKSLEEPPPRTLWILLASKRERLLPTVLSRCRPIALRALPQGLVRSILESNGIPRGEAEPLARAAEGSPGLALSLRETPLPDPGSWLADPMAPFRLAESLPRELALARRAAQGQIRQMAWHARARAAGAGLAAPGPRRTLSRLESLSAALRSNADPRLALQLAALELQKLAP